MNTIGLNANSYMDSMKNHSDQNLQVQTNSANVQIRQAKNAEMELVTKDGDKITLSFSSEANSGYSTYNQNGRIDDTTWSNSLESMYSETESNTQIKIEGDLNKEELKDILKAVRKLEKAMNKLLDGNTDEAVETLLDASSGKTIASFDSTISFAKSIDIEKQYQALSTDSTNDVSVPENNIEPVKQTKLKDSDKTELQKNVENLKEVSNKSKIPNSVLRSSFEKFFDKKISYAENNTTFKDSGIMDFFKQMRNNLLDGLLPDNKKVSKIDE